MKKQQTLPFLKVDSRSRHIPSTNPIAVRHSTFLGGLGERIHRWFRLTPSFGPDLVQHLLAEMDTPPTATLLDPFSGAGTTLIEGALEGHECFGFEINPLLHFVCEASLSWDLDPESVHRALSSVEARFSDARARHSGHHYSDLGLKIPPIHNVERWWRPDVLADLMLLLDAIRTADVRPRERRFLELALAGALVPDLTNVTLGRLQLHFIDRSEDDIDVGSSFGAHARIMLEDLHAVRSIPSTGTASVFLTDATAPDVGRELPRIDRVVTSPPYPNRYSYVWNTRPHLYLLGLFSTPKEAGALDLKTIGGTWGVATSWIADGTLPYAHPAVERCIESVVAEIRATDNLMANYLVKYFNLLASQILAMRPFLSDTAKLAYVVGCSRLKGAYVETDVLLGKLFEELGCGSVSQIERFRKRHSGKDLHEATVYVDCSSR